MNHGTPSRRLYWLLLAATAVTCLSGCCTTRYIKSAVSEDVKQALLGTPVREEGKLLVGFIDSALASKELVNDVYSQIPQNERVQRIAEYVRAKQSAEPAWEQVQASLADFNWQYLTRDVEYVPVRVTGDGNSALREIEYSGFTYTWMPQKRLLFWVSSKDQFEPGSTLLIPIEPGADKAYALPTLTFDVEGAQATWTGYLDSDEVHFARARTSQGCEIHVRSMPKAAQVFFNGDEWYRRTDTSVIRDPGTWNVEVRLEGFKPWRQSATLDAGGSWNIEARLEPE